jgi:hypothetical protein
LRARVAPLLIVNRHTAPKLPARLVCLKTRRES